MKLPAVALNLFLKNWLCRVGHDNDGKAGGSKPRRCDRVVCPKEQIERSVDFASHDKHAGRTRARVAKQALHLFGKDKKIRVTSRANCSAQLGAANGCGCVLVDLADFNVRGSRNAQRVCRVHDTAVLQIPPLEPPTPQRLAVAHAVIGGKAGDVVKIRRTDDVGRQNIAHKSLAGRGDTGDVLLRQKLAGQYACSCGQRRRAQETHNRLTGYTRGIDSLRRRKVFNSRAGYRAYFGF